MRRQPTRTWPELALILIVLFGFFCLSGWFTMLAIGMAHAWWGIATVGFWCSGLFATVIFAAVQAPRILTDAVRSL